MSHIFLSYSRNDSVFADHLRDLLENEGFDVWIDRREIIPSQEWQLEIEHAIRSCRVFIVIMSPDAQQSQPVNDEIELARKYKKTIFPVLLAGKVWPPLSHLQVADMGGGVNLPLPPRFALSLRQIVDRVIWRKRQKLIGAALTTIALVVALNTLLLRGKHKEETPPDTTSTNAAVSTSIITAEVSNLLPTSTAIVRHTSTPIPAGSTVEFGIHDEMTLNGVQFVFVPAGCFMMGSTQDEIDAVFQQCKAELGTGSCSRELFEVESPVHEVCVSDYWIGLSEVTNAQYRECVEAGKCTTPREMGNYVDANYPDHPVAYVDWNQANVYANWLSETTGTEVRLPTEAQWEYAARGPQANRYPWGNEDATCYLANVSVNGVDCVGHTSRVGLYSAGASWVGALDMSGNVWEWAADWYDKHYYEALTSKVLDPAGPSSGEYGLRVVRGGSCYSYRNFAWAAYRSGDDPYNRYFNLGFRVVYVP